MTQANVMPMVVSDLDVAFPARIDHLLPKWDEIPEEFKRGHTDWNRIVSNWFFDGLKRPFPFKAKDGVDESVALRHVQACLGSFEPKHEHKEAGCAYLLSLWFDPAAR